MQFRVGGLMGLVSGLRDASAHPTEANWPAELSLQADGLITSDVIWHDFFVTPTAALVKRDGDKGAIVPASTFVANANVTAPSAMTAVLTAIAAQPRRPRPQSPVLQLGDQGGGQAVAAAAPTPGSPTRPGSASSSSPASSTSRRARRRWELQTAAAITGDGVVGPMTRAALTSQLAQSG